MVYAVSGCEDILISSLSEKKTDRSAIGKVYLFSGRSIYSLMQNTGRGTGRPEILQEFANTNTELFGFSIGESRTDLDGNGFNDLVVGDPGKNNQRAYVYYAITTIKLLHSEGIQRKLLPGARKIHKSCPIKNTTEFFNFCEPFEVTLNNRGVLRKEGANPDTVAKLVPWKFVKPFRIDVSLEKLEDSSLFKIYEVPQTVVFDGTKNESVIFYVYGQIPERYGATIQVRALTTVRDGDEVILEETYQVPTTLAKETFSAIDVSVSTLADVTLEADPKNLQVVFGDKKETIVVGAIIRTVSMQPEYLVNGILKLNLGTASVGFSTAKTSPAGVAACRKDS